MSLSMISEGQGKWEYVPSKKDRDQGKRTKAELKILEPTQAALNSNSTTSAFAALDKWQRKQEPASDSEESVGEQPTAKGNSYFTAEEQKNLTVTAGKSKKIAPTLQKKPKVKKVKVSAKEVAAGLKAKDVSAQLKALEHCYKDSHTSQCEMAADYLWKTFSEADLPFNKLLSEQPLDKAAEIPLQYLPKDVANVLSTWLGSRSPVASEALAMNLITAVFDGMPEYASRNAPVQPPKAKVGLLLLLSSVLRVQPAVMVGLCPTLLAKGSAFTAPLRLPQTLWLLSQLTAGGDAGVAVAIHTWCSVILPQVVGSTLPVFREEPRKVTMMQKDAAVAAIGWISDTLQAAKCSSSGLQGLARSGISGPASSTVPVVPCGAMEAISRTVCGGELEGAQPPSAPKGIPSKVAREGLMGILPDIRETAFGGALAGGFPCDDALVLALETAESSSGPFTGPGSQLVAESAKSIVSALAGADSAFAKFEEKHKKMIKGSSRVLQHLACEKPPCLDGLLSLPGKAPLLSGLLQALRRRHQLYVEANKGWQGACGVASEEAVLQLGTSTRRMIAKQLGARFGSSGFLAALLVAGLAIGASVYVVAEPEAARAIATRFGLPAYLVDEVIRRVPPEYTTHVRTGLAAAVEGSRDLAEKAAPLLSSANETLSAAAAQLKQAMTAMAQQYSA